MSVRADAVLREALNLPARERAEVAAEFVASLDDEHPSNPEAIEAAWAEELEQRTRRALSGEDPGHAWPELRDQLRTRHAG